MKLKYIIFPLVLFLFLSVSCSKTDEQSSGEEEFDVHSTWTPDSTNNFWDKQGGRFQINTAWDGDTTIIF